MPDIFAYAVKFVLSKEGGFSDDPLDPGGATNFGISLKFYRDAIKKDATIQDIQNLTEYDASLICKQWFWDLYHCDDMPPAIGLIVFDMAVNQGPYMAISSLQRAVGLQGSNIDGLFGPATKIRLNTIYAQDGASLINRLCAIRAYTYALNDGQFKRFGLGWMQRTMEAHQYALQIFNQAKET